MDSDKVQMLVILTPKPGKEDQLVKFAEDGAKHHLEVPACTRWLFSRQINSADGVESFILVQEWASVEALVDHSKWEYSVKMREQLAELTTRFEFKMSKVFTGFDAKAKE